jgi:hypothetical protein
VAAVYASLDVAWTYFVVVRGYLLPEYALAECDIGHDATGGYMKVKNQRENILILADISTHDKF